VGCRPRTAVPIPIANRLAVQAKFDQQSRYDQRISLVLSVEDDLATNTSIICCLHGGSPWRQAAVGVHAGFDRAGPHSSGK